MYLYVGTAFYSGGIRPDIWLKHWNPAWCINLLKGYKLFYLLYIIHKWKSFEDKREESVFIDSEVYVS